MKTVRIDPGQYHAIASGTKTTHRILISPQPRHLQEHAYRGKEVYEGEHRMWCWKDQVFENLWDFPGSLDRVRLATHCPYDEIRFVPDIHHFESLDSIKVEVVSLGIELLQEITDAGARSEGFPLLGTQCRYVGDKCNSSRCQYHNPRAAFAAAWDRNHRIKWGDGVRGPFVWVIGLLKLA